MFKTLAQYISPDKAYNPVCLLSVKKIEFLENCGELIYGREDSKTETNVWKAVFLIFFLFFGNIWNWPRFWSIQPFQG